MTRLLDGKYNNVLELIEETGKIPIRCIDDGDFEDLKEELSELGFTCELSPSTDFLFVKELSH